MRKIIVVIFTILTSMPVMAQGIEVIRGGCTPDLLDGDAAMTRGGTFRKLPSINTNWSAERVYKQLVVLISFADTDFSLETPRETYDSIFNEPGYNQRNGAGCVADYFREQSGGLFNLEFDVYGPYEVNSLAQPYDDPDEDTRNYGREVMVEATKKFLEENPEIDFRQYDWNGNGRVNQVIYVYAGYCGNQSASKSYGHIWPNTSSFTSITTPDRLIISDYTVSSELWTDNRSCGIGTICHEFSHSLGLPDIYPTNGWAYSAVDEWDLMDGGNFTNYGWCPPNYSSLEKMLLGWLKPVELTEPTSVKEMKSVADGGPVYRVKHTETEYLLLENRQQKGWDLGAPGKGLVAFHVDYSGSAWSGNTVNNRNGKFRYSLVHADNMDYDQWYEQLVAWRNDGKISSQYAEKQHLQSLFLSTSPYPWVTDTTAMVNELTDVSVPAATMFNANIEGKKLLGKPITNITMSEDGLISFDFMGGDQSTDISRTVRDSRADAPARIFDLTGRQLRTAPRSRIYVTRDADGNIRKVIQ